MTQFNVNDRVVRISNGRSGEVIELNLVDRRARIKWSNGSPRTWISFKDLRREPLAPLRPPGVEPSPDGYVKSDRWTE
jgi:hypothetical protein